MREHWHELPTIVMPSPVLALAWAGPANEGLYAGGAGGVAWRDGASDWLLRSAGLHLSAITALAAAGGWLLAGGPEGIARSSDGGRRWQLAAVATGGAPVAAIAPTPTFGDDGVALAATLGEGVLRTSDAGRSWATVNFGLQELEVTALAWAGGEQALAGTADGIYRSPNGGRAWRPAVGSEGVAVAALAMLHKGGVLAALETGGLLRSDDGGITWAPYGQLLEDLAATALLVSPTGVVLLGSSSHGLLRSDDDGATWMGVAAEPILTLSAAGDSLYAGTVAGVLCSDDDGGSWWATEPPPLHDLRRLRVAECAPIVAGTYSGAVRFDQAVGWRPLQTPLPLGALELAPDGALFAAGPAGLFRSHDVGASWQLMTPEPLGLVALISTGADGASWAAASDGPHLMHTDDDGSTWQASDWPFGAMSLIALRATSGALLAATYDRWQQACRPWRSPDGGETWERGAPTATLWPLAASWHDPPLLALGSVLLVERADGGWSTSTVTAGDGAVRRVVGDETILLALATTGVYCSRDRAASWQPWDEASDLPVQELIDIALHAAVVYVLLSGGRVWWRSLVAVAGEAWGS